MTKAFVHGNPETAALWGPLVDSLAARGVDDVALLSPPGFGASVNDDWPATQIAYRDWLVGELESLGGAVDVLGHDWGAGHVFGALAERPDLLNSWAADCAGLIHPDYEWHDAAQAWQTPDVGEEFIAAMLGGAVEDRERMLTDLGMTPGVAAEVALGGTEDMGRCVLDLYRSAVQPAMSDLGQRLRGTEQRPGLVIIATDDHYAGTIEMASEVAESLGAATTILEGEGHWWMFSGADAAADALMAHWDGA